jgi:ADP-ribose pyrophosphatase YjhB (NUDIX family)
MTSSSFLCKGVNPPTENLWDIPGGFISLDETAEKATVREFLEETDLEVHDLKYIGSYPSEYLFEGINYPVLNFVFAAKVRGDLRKMKPQDDVKELRFFDPENIPYEEFAFEWTKKMLKDYFGKK